MWGMVSVHVCILSTGEAEQVDPGSLVTWQPSLISDPCLGREMLSHKTERMVPEE